MRKKPLAVRVDQPLAVKTLRPLARFAPRFPTIQRKPRRLLAIAHVRIENVPVKA